MSVRTPKARFALRALFALAAALAVAPILAPADASALCGMPYRFPPAYYQAREAAARGDVEEAVRLYQASARYPGQAKYWIASAYVTAAQKATEAGQLALGVTYYKRALAEQSSLSGAAQGLVGALTRAGRYHEALDSFRAFHASVADSSAMLRERAKLHARVRDKVGVREALEKLRARGELTAADLELLSGSGGVRFQGPGKFGRM